MKNNVMLVSDSKCSGCSACMNVCPVDAIRMQPNEEGFLMPQVDDAVCVDCGKCLATCPELHTRYENYPSPKVYAAMAEDELRMKSSSGGMFSLFAEHFLGRSTCRAASAIITVMSKTP